ncbi:hypothetical protein SPHINGOT1_200108 [Sphingomonas sp. T1]|nr:hypothetical protein SPHINGOT1_200108 [Sphingomonas sp. T1]
MNYGEIGFLTRRQRSINHGQISFAGSDRRLPEQAFEVAEHQGHAERPNCKSCRKP